MRHLILSLFVLLFVAHSAAGQFSTGTAKEAPAAVNRFVGVLYDAGGIWVTDFALSNGAIVTVPHDPSLGDLILVTVPGGAPVFISLSTLEGWIDNDDNLALPAVAGSSQCWLIPYGPPDPETGTMPFQPTPTSFTGEGNSLTSALKDYKEQVADAMAGGAVPAPGIC